jgi:hypothetical protein
MVARDFHLHEGVVKQEIQPDDDPRPAEPPRPDDSACCGQGCNPCIFDLYELERARYEAKLRAWEERQAAWQRPSGES